MSGLVLRGRGLIGGRASGEALVSRQAISGWSGLDERTGVVIERGHPFEGQSVKGKVLILSGGKGSNGWSIHFHAAKLRGIGPAALVLPRLDSRLAVTVAALGLPALTDLEADPFDLVPMGALVVVDADLGLLEVVGPAAPEAGGAK